MQSKSLREYNQGGLDEYKPYAYRSSSYQAMAELVSADQGGGKRRAVTEIRLAPRCARSAANIAEHFH
jgi:hypothetical protein